MFSLTQEFKLERSFFLQGSQEMEGGLDLFWETQNWKTEEEMPVRKLEFSNLGVDWALYDL